MKTIGIVVSWFVRLPIYVIRLVSFYKIHLNRIGHNFVDNLIVFCELY